jgi:hypothetical protein
MTAPSTIDQREDEYADEVAELDDGPDPSDSDAFAELGPSADERPITNRLWIYDRGPDGFTARTRDPVPAFDATSPAGDSLWRASAEAEFDIRVYDGPPVEAVESAVQ